MDPRSHLRTLAGAAFGAVAAIAASVALACGGGSGSVELSDLAQRGRGISIGSGCASCHGRDGEGGVGPAWEGLYGSEVELADGTTVVADDAYLRRSILDPGAELVAGYTINMPENPLGEEEIAAVIAYIRSLG